MDNRKKIKIAIIILCLAIFAGCQGTHSQKKKEMQTKWRNTASEIKLTAAIEQFEAGQFAQAEAAAKEYIISGQNPAEANLLLGKIRLAEGDLSQAKSYLQVYLRSKQNSDEGWFLLGLACDRLNDKENAFKWYQKSLELSPENTDCVIAIARLYVAQNKFAEAEKLYQEKIASSPSDVDLKIAAGQMYLEWGQKDKAIGLYEQAHFTIPDNAEILEALGSCYILAENWQKAHDVHKQLHQQCTSDAEKKEYLKIMAFTANQAGDYTSAMKYYSQLMTEDRTNAKLWVSMGQAALGTDSLRQALICSKKAIALSPGMTEAYLLSGSANYKSGNYNQAIDDFQKAASNTDCGNFSWLMTGRCYEKIGKDAEAKSAYEKAEQYGNGGELQKLLAKTNREG